MNETTVYKVLFILYFLLTLVIKDMPYSSAYIYWINFALTIVLSLILLISLQSPGSESKNALNHKRMTIILLTIGCIHLSFYPFLHSFRKSAFTALPVWIKLASISTILIVSYLFFKWRKPDNTNSQFK